ncbi:vWA domain-containing protein [Paenibacillus alkalitolerans]|uniref:vWA domain-containing protein n=1 Tax=Paenibacillus alkalitolerans TaxID=2799335 RepID=UPI0018F6081B|nr:von Willebrand factor type A domain-containing protein [Paenibacillus alkalitolerans]
MKRGVFLTAFAMILLLTGCSAASNAGGSESAAESENHAQTEEQSSAAAKDGASTGSAQDSASSEPAPPKRKPKPSALPNGEPYDDMYFDHTGTNPFVTAEEDPLSTFAVDVDTGSYTIARNYVSRGELPPKDAIRVEEFINYFDMRYEAPAKKAFTIHVDGGDSPFGEGYKLVRIALKGKEIEASDRKPVNLTFVIDVSGSMNREDRLELVKKSLKLLVDSLSGSDQIAIVTYGSDARAVLEPVSLEEKDEVLDAIESLTPGGSTNAEEGLKLGYEVADKQFSGAAVNRVILCSDGVANVGETSAEGILKQIEDYAERGITLTSVGVGMSNYNDVMMEKLADQGNGAYAYVDSFSEARRLFVDDLTGTLQTIARDVKIQVEFDPKRVDRYRLIGYENRDVADEDFRDNRVDAGEVGAGHSVTALYEVKLIDTEDDAADFGEVRVRYLDEKSGRTEEWSEPLRIGNKISRDLAFLASVAEYAELLRGSYWAKNGSMKDVLQLLEASAETEQEHQFAAMVKDTVALLRSDD